MISHSFTRSVFFTRGVRLAAIAAALIAAVAIAPCASAQLSIAATFDTTITSDPNGATIVGTLNQAIAFYAATFSDPITVNIKFVEQSTGLGASSTAIATAGYSTIRGAMTADAKTTNDAVALANTPGGATNPVNGGSSIVVTTANLRALGFAIAPPGGFDGTIFLNTSIMNLTRSSIDPSKYDLLAVAEHEIDEVLGLGSGLNLPPSVPFIRMEDLFRFTSTAGTRTFTTSGDNAFFSIDGGVTDLARFNQNSGGDYGDWWSVGAHTPQVQDAFGTPGTTPNMGVETTALDVIGYDLVTLPVPEPATYGLMRSEEHTS